jgi:hypothetical protein
MLLGHMGYTITTTITVTITITITITTTTTITIIPPRHHAAGSHGVQFLNLYPVFKFALNSCCDL